MPLMSMTGFGHAKRESDTVEISVEIKTVNHRFLDVSAKLPSQYAPFENELTKLVRSRLKRGRTDLYVSRRRIDERAQVVRFNHSLLRSYWREVSSAARQVGGVSEENSARVLASLLTRREVLDVTIDDEDVSSEQELLNEVVNEALEEVLQMRRREGEELEKELQSLLKEVENNTKTLKKQTAETPGQLQARLTERLEKLLAGTELDQDRLVQEVAYLADKADVTEELTRMESHIGQFRSIIKKQEGGRKLDFVLQEMGREVNTIGSKAQDAAVTALVVDCKAVLEKLREQVQNIE